MAFPESTMGEPGQASGHAVKHALIEIPVLSVVLPFYNEEANLTELLARLRTVLKRTVQSYELIFVDDGSTDGGVALIEHECKTDARIKLLVLSRNFGQHVAGTAGIDVARGSMVIWMDTDLQERPEDIPALVSKCNEGFDTVYARRRARKQPKLRAAMSNLALRFMNRLVRLNVSPDRACMRLFTAKVARAIRGFEERNRYMGYLMPWSGFRTAEIEIDIDPRKQGETKYSLWRLMRLAWTGVTAFSVAPLRIAAILSIASIAACIIGVSYVLYRYFAYGFVISGWASLIIAVLLLHSLQFAVTAVLGEYIGLTYTETKRRPLYFLARHVNMSNATGVARSLAVDDALLKRIDPGTGIRTIDAPPSVVLSSQSD